MSEVATSQPPPATEGGAPWGSFYTATDKGPAPASAKAKSKAPRRKRSSETEPAVEKKSRRARGSVGGGGRRSEGRRRSFSLRRGPREKGQEASPAPVPLQDTEPELPPVAAPAPQDTEPGLPPVAAPAKSRRYAEPHVLVGVVGGTIIALAALLIALLYMIGTAA